LLPRLRSGIDGALGGASITYFQWGVRKAERLKRQQTGPAASRRAATGVSTGKTMTRESNVGRQWREAEQIIRQSGRPVPFDELHHQLLGRAENHPVHIYSRV
jgi:hypothetical protein